MDFSSRKENLDHEMAMPPAGSLLASSVKAKKYTYLVPWKPKNTGCCTSGVPSLKPERIPIDADGGSIPALTIFVTCLVPSEFSARFFRKKIGG